MNKSNRKNIVALIIICVIISATSLGISMYSKGNTSISISKNFLKFDMSNWNYDEVNNIYYKMNVGYCKNSEKEKNEVFEIYVPGEYLIGKKNEDGTYNCSINTKGSKSIFTQKNAPMIISIESKEEIEQIPHEKYNYEDALKYTSEGYIYIWPGYRGLKENEIAESDEKYGKAVTDGITDLKALVRYCRFNKELLPGTTDKILVFGKKEGGVKSALLGASGDSGLYHSELITVGAAMEYQDDSSISDGVNGTMCSSLTNDTDMFKKSHSWFIEQYLNNESNIKAIRDEVTRYAGYLNNLKLKSEDGTLLFLADSMNKLTFTNGTYYNYIVTELEKVIDRFLKNTTFPYFNENTKVTYLSAKEYVNSLNNKTKWISYDESTNTVKITKIEDFANYYNYKKQSKQRITQNQYNLYYYLSNKYGGKANLFVSRYWNICTMFDDKCSSFINDENIKLLLQNNEDVKKIVYNCIWAKDYTEKEKNEFIFNNFKSWVKSCY